MKKYFFKICAAFLISLSAIGEQQCIDSSFIYNNNVGGKWAYASHELGTGYAYAYAGWQGTVAKNVFLVTYYTSNKVLYTFQSVTLTNVRSAATGMTIPLCGGVTSATSTCHVEGSTAIAEVKVDH